MLEMSHIYPTRDAHIFHVVHPRIVPFNTLILSAASCLNVPLVPFPEWFSKLSEEHKAQSHLDAKLGENASGQPGIVLAYCIRIGAHGT